MTGTWTPAFKLGRENSPPIEAQPPNFFTQFPNKFSASYIKIGNLVNLNFKCFCDFSDSPGWTQFLSQYGDRALWLTGIPYSPSDSEAAAFCYNWATPAGFALVQQNDLTIRNSNSSIVSYMEQDRCLLIFNITYKTNQ